MKFLILFYICTFFRDSSAVQTWEQQPSYTEVNPGDRATLPCKIYNKKGSCAWQKDGKPQGMFAGKIEWAGNQATGDCSLRIHDASEVDDGDWECQVTASSFSAHDALTSYIAKLVVRVAPDPPQMEVGSSHLSSSHNFTVREGIPSSIKCVARYGNPPPRIKWFLGGEEIFENMYNQTNDTEVDRPKTYRAVSVLHTSFVKRDNGRSLRCISVHEAYPTRSRDVSLPLDVQYSPTVTLQGAPASDIEENVDRVALQCLADANPPANIIWKRVGDNNIFSFQQTIEFSPATRKHTGKYACKASNAVGVSDPLSVTLDVKFGPRVERVEPDSALTAQLQKQAKINCFAVGNPLPSYEWFQVTPTGRKIKRGDNSTLVIETITYEHQGQYFCVAHNNIKGNRKDHHSKPVILQVVGAPQVLRYTVEPQMEVFRGDDALIQMTFCSDPEPLKTTWQWGSQQLDAGSSRGRFTAIKIIQENVNKDCYQARLKIHGVDMSDARNYYLTVQNEKGADRYAVALLIKEPVSMSTVIGTIVTCLIILVVVTLGIFYAFKTEKCCFSQSDEFKPTDIENNRNSLDGQKIGHGMNSALYSSGSLVGGTLSPIPPDALYSSPAKRLNSTLPCSRYSQPKYQHDYENIQNFQVPMVTQNTLMVTKRRLRSSSCSSTTSTPSSTHCPHKPAWAIKDEHMSKSTGNLWHAPVPTSPTTKISPTITRYPNFSQNNGLSRTMVRQGPADCEGCHRNDRFIPGLKSPRRQGNIIYAELQMPKTHPATVCRGKVQNQLGIVNGTQYAEITFKGRPTNQGIMW